MKQIVKVNYTSLDLLGFNAVGDRIHKRWEKEVDMAHHDVDHMRSMSSKPMNKCQTNDSDIEYQDAAGALRSLALPSPEAMPTTVLRIKIEEKKMTRKSNKTIANTTTTG